MSLINEALKRTRDASYQAGATRPQSVENYRITSQPEAKSRGLRVALWAVVIVGAAVVAVVGILAIRTFKNAQVTSDLTEVNHISNPVATPSATAAVAEAPVVAPVPSATAAKAAAQAASDDQLVARVVEKLKAEEPVPASAPVPVVEPEPPKFVLQGITSDGKERSVLINDVELRVGDEFMGAKVTVIESRLVRLKFGEKEIVLRMP